MARITLGHRIQYGIYRIFEACLRLGSVGTAYSLGTFIGRVAFPLAAPLRKVVSRNLAFAFGKEDPKLTRDIFKKTTGNLLSSIRIPFLSEEKVRECVTVKNLEILHEAEATGKGTILLIPHMGNWELLAQSPRLSGLTTEFATHYRPLNNPLLNDLIERRRKKRGVKLFPKRTSSHTLTKFLRENGILAILADQRMPGKGDVCPFFDRPTLCSPLPALLAKRTDATIIGLHCTTLAKDRWELTLTKVEGRDSAACAANLEQAWRSSPSDVFWFQDRWKLPKSKPLRAFLKGPYPSREEAPRPLKAVILDDSPLPELDLPEHLIQWERETSEDPVDLWVSAKHEKDFPFRTHHPNELV